MINIKINCKTFSTKYLWGVHEKFLNIRPNDQTSEFSLECLLWSGLKLFSNPLYSLRTNVIWLLMSKGLYFNCKKNKQPTLYQESQSKLEYFCYHFLFIGYEFGFFLQISVLYKIQKIKITNKILTRMKESPRLQWKSYWHY